MSALPSDPTHATLVGIADAIQAREISSVEITTAVIARAAQWQPKLNAFIALDAESALAAAKAADAKPGPGKLHGVPLAHKDMYYRAGRIATCGSQIRRHWKAETTATALARLDAAGAVDLGTLNMAEFAFGPTGHNYHFGHARNPWNTDYITGGSSSGSGAAVAARLAFAALGSDTGGSIRMPALCNGLVGIKPTWGRVSRHGAMTLSWTMDTVGPLTRTVRDCARVFSIIAGADENDHTAANVAVPDYEAACQRPVRGLKLGIPEGYFDADLDSDVADAWDNAAEIFEKLGVELKRVKLPDLEAVNAAGALTTACEGAAAHRPWMETRLDEYSPQVRARLMSGLAVPGIAYIDAQRIRAAMLARFNAEVFGKVDALLAPTLNTPIPTIAEGDVADGPLMPAFLGRMTRLSRPFNAMGLPSLSVPMRFDRNGLPLGLQIAGRAFDEATLFALGAAFEREVPFFNQAPTLKG